MLTMESCQANKINKIKLSRIYNFRKSKANQLFPRADDNNHNNVMFKVFDREFGKGVYREVVAIDLMNLFHSSILSWDIVECRK